MGLFIMLELLYQIFIAPLELIMSFILGWAFAATHSHGLSIIILGLAVNLLLIPIYHVAEKWQHSERQLQQKMAPKISEIKQVYKGQERFMMLKTLYRQHGYHPFLATRSSLGFIIQIPFFIAAFHLLGHYPPFQGTEFLIFNNLAMPDGLLDLGGASINIMPLVMTAVNLASGFVYARSLTSRDKFQVLLIAAVFLVLLYKSPVALVIYWTFNNIFSLVKNILYNKTGTFNFNATADTGKPPPGAPGKIRIPPHIGQRLKTIKEGYIGFSNKLSLPLWAIIPLLLFFVYNNWQYNTAFKHPTMGDGHISYALVIAMLVYLNLITVGRFLEKNSPNFWSITRSLVIIACVTTSIVLLLSLPQYHTTHTIGIVKSNVRLALALAWLTAMDKTLVLRWLEAWLNKHIPEIPTTTKHTLFCSSLLLLLSLIYVHGPMDLYLSDPKEFSFGIEHLLPWLCLYLLVSFLMLLLFYRALFNSFSSTIIYMTVILSILATLYAYFFTGNYSIITAFRFAQESTLIRPSDAYYDGTIIIATILLFFFLARTMRTRVIATLLILFNISAITLTSYNLLSAEQSQQQVQFNNANGSGTDKLATFSEASNTDIKSGLHLAPSYAQDLLSFSKDKQNIVIMMLDNFTGGFIKPLVEEHPDLATELEGFTWYANTLSASNLTKGGEPGIHGGHDFTPYSISRRNTGPIEAEVTKSYKVFVNAFGDQGYDVSIINPQYTSCDKIMQQTNSSYIKVCEEDYNDFRSYWEYTNGLTHSQGISPRETTLLLSAIGLFKASPYTLRPRIYDKANWAGSLPDHLRTEEDTSKVLRKLSSLDSLHQLSNTNSQRSTLKYIQNELAHHPYRLNGRTCKPDGNAQKPHYESAYCTLKTVINWFNWMKKAGVYNNTKIILVSDHDGGGNSPMMAKPLIEKINSTLQLSVIGPHALLMVKDFNQAGPLVRSDVFMSNADTPAIACSAIGGCSGIVKDPTKYPIQDRELFHSVITSKGSNSYNIVSEYKVTNNIFDGDSWEKLNQFY